MTFKHARISNTYAKGLLMGRSKENLQRFIANTHLCHSILKQSISLKKTLFNPLVERNKKKLILKKILDGKVEKDFLNFLFIVCDHKKSNLLPDILNKTIQLAYKHQKTQYATIESTIPLTQTQKQSLQNKLKILTGAHEIQLQPIINQELIGGIIIHTTLKTIDFSIKTQLQKLSKSLAPKFQN
ncbi:ATP synthase CF1 delta subunit (plastid) [Cryptomonas paramecium]|uniref:ATP synthase CF1 delta subunit n=1 Tax=Cryptomonas paramaecium TaxID=2898 RepID=D2IS72_9CRYP|nr:ATP synthase CF1 delta subunit [Cryptomonas paramecium]ACT46764.1 ATP synthase CF1 delta subunit [Cryptomonas paramecium]BDA98032.1 ATP synthase CF1 delta subunit [Cryptomonas paramecium]